MPNEQFEENDYDSIRDDFSDAGDGSINQEESLTPETSRDEVAELKKLVDSESKKISFWRVIISVSIVLIGAGVTWMTYKFLSEDETNSFETAFDQYAASIVETTNFNAMAIASNFASFMDHLTTYTTETNSTWPMFTYPDLDVHGKNLLEQTLAVGIMIGHLVDREEKNEWEAYTQSNADFVGRPFVPVIHRVDNNTQPDPINIGPGPWLAMWEMYPSPLWPLYNYDFLPDFANFEPMRDIGRPIYARPLAEDGGVLDLFPDAADRQPGEPFTSYSSPLYDDSNKTNLVGALQAFLVWGRYFQNLLPDGISGVDVVLETHCGDFFTWQLDGPSSTFVGKGDLHETKYDKNRFSTLFGSTEIWEGVAEAGLCEYSVSVYPTSEFEDSFTTNKPLLFSLAVGGVFVLVIIAFLAFDFFQTKRNQKMVSSAAKTSAVVTSLFPTEFRDRLLQDSETSEESSQNLPKEKKNAAFHSQEQRIKSFLEGKDPENAMKPTKALKKRSKPLAEFYPSVTIMFADIAGFTAWCSSREPSQVFELLESTYAAYDRIAKRRRVFKVETVGDCYVAAAGLSDKRKDHALAMARYAHECMRFTIGHFKKLESILGPDTGDLSLRIGLHTGSITAGVLRGDKARFQLFGDTMNTAARMEGTGVPGAIQISNDTAMELIASGKGHWLRRRETQVEAKGKGLIQTHFLNITRDAKTSVTGESVTSGGSSDIPPSDTSSKDKQERLVDWHVDVFSGLLKQITSQRDAKEKVWGCAAPRSSNQLEDRQELHKAGETCLDEVKEIIELPIFDRVAAKNQAPPESIELPVKVVQELRDYIRTVAMLYHENPFHNFAHASHVTMSVRKLLSRINMPSDLTVESKDGLASTLHDHTYGITSDPLTQFAVVFAALIHDVDHQGVPNTQLAKEKPDLAYLYHNKSTAEQNSVVLSWELLMDNAFCNLRNAICSSPEEKQRFRQIVVQTVLATDIVDKELKALRNNRWNIAFSDTHHDEDPQDTVNRKATIVIEHLIQASDVSHTMQHWHVYRKWNEHFFCECYQAYLDGRSETDPSVNWYKGEIGFFDFYVIPLAKKLKDCGVFGVSSDEYLSYAELNRNEWEKKGQQVVEEMLQKFSSKGTK